MEIALYIWDFLVIGLLLLGITLGSSWITRLPLSYALIYLITGIFLGPYGFNIIDLKPDAEFLERLTEIVVLVSLFSCGIKMNRPLTWSAWHSTIRLIGLLMPLSIAAIAGVAHFALGIGWGAAILLGAILSPTDPVLASEVQLVHTNDPNELRFGLTSEGGLNDALAFPFVYFGLYLLDDENWQAWLGDWLRIDLIWGIFAGILGGILVAKLIGALERRSRRLASIEEEVEDLIALATILLTYSLTEMINGYGFLAVFVAGVTVRRNRSIRADKKASQLHFTGLLERLLEIGTILLVGVLLRWEPIVTFGGQALLIALALILLIRPIATWISTLGDDLRPATRLLFGWFGIRGVGSLYYMAYALSEGLPEDLGAQISWITVFTVALSVVIHGMSATPLMNWYEQRFGHESRMDPETLTNQLDNDLEDNPKTL
ncbi:MAG: sodium:proton antiporter [Elainella sp. Prado103]|jgi:NhaP-type Na+/H+ or K+/H+ antiporter|nr:sodium:proton antiporter [Elainella sp. Prado103]